MGIDYKTFQGNMFEIADKLRILTPDNNNPGLSTEDTDIRGLRINELIALAQKPLNGSIENVVLLDGNNQET